MDSGEMRRDEGDDTGDDLRALFAREQVHVAEQPFVNDVARRVALARRRRTFATRAAQAAAVGALIAMSPWLVKGSESLSSGLDGLFSSVAVRLDSPYGYGAGMICLIAAAIVFRRRLFG
jgi:hypothetical protein